MAKGETKLKILRVGAGLIHERGYSATGLSDILSASGVPKGSFYHYYPSKESFALDALGYHLGFLLSWLSEALSAEGSPLGPLERLRAYFEQYRQYLRERGFRGGCPVGTLAQEAGSLPHSIRERLSEAFALMQEPIETCLTEARRAGELPPGMDPTSAASFILNSWQGAMLRMKAVGTDTPLREFGQMVFGALLKS